MRWRLLWTVCAFAPWAAVAGQSADTKRTGQDTVTGHPKAEEDDFTVSARDWKAPTKRGFKQSAAARVVVTDINPFAFTYRIEHKGAAVVEAAPAVFANAVFGLALPITAKVQEILQLEVNGSPLSIAIAKANASTCKPPAAAELRERIVEMEGLRATRARIAAAAKDLAIGLTRPTDAFAEALKRARADTNAPTTNQAGRTARRHGRIVVATYQEALQKIRPLVSSWIESVRKEGRESELAVVRHPQCADLRALRLDFLGLVPDTLQTKEYLGTITARAAEMAQTVAAMDAIVDHPGKYYLTIRVPSYRQPADVEVVISTQPLKANLTPVTTGTGEQARPVKFDTVGRYSFNVGGRGRLSMSAGMVWGDLPDRSYGVVQRSTPGLDGASTTGFFVDITKDSPGRIVPMLFLNTNMCWWCSDHPRAPSLQAVLGVTPKALAITKLEYFFGGAIGLFEDRLYIKSGWFIAPFDRLNGGLALGDQLPAGQTSVSTRSVLAARLGMALSYRVAPW